MSWFIIVLIVLSLFGSIAWVKPSPRQKFLAQLRLDARALGFNCRLVQLTSPRPKGETEGDKRSIMAFRLLREGHGFEQMPENYDWHIFNVENIASDGLPSGWSWSKGEKTLSKPLLDVLAQIITKMPAGVVSIDGNSVAVTAYWDEKGDTDTLKQIKENLVTMMEQGL